MLIAQLSDIHIRPKGKLYKDVADSKQGLIDAISHLHELDCRPDLVLLTGDLVDEGKSEEYSHLRELLRGLHIPYFVMPGNHDNRENLRSAFREHLYLPLTGPLNFCIDEFPVRIIALDTSVSGHHFGALDSQSLTWLQGVLAADRSKPTIVALHHPPFVSGIPYLDRCRYLEPDPLAALLSEAKNVDLIVCGHVHRTMIRRWAGTVVAACPSTSTEIALQLNSNAQPQSFKSVPACMLHLWEPDIGLVTHVSYIGRFEGPYPFF